MDRKRKFRCGVCGIDFTSWREYRQHLQSKAHKRIANKGNIQLFLERLSDGVKKLKGEK